MFARLSDPLGPSYTSRNQSGEVCPVGVMRGVYVVLYDYQLNAIRVN